MAYYLVTAKPKPDRLPNLLRNLQGEGVFHDAALREVPDLLPGKRQVSR